MIDICLVIGIVRGGEMVGARRGEEMCYYVFVYICLVTAVAFYFSWHLG